MDMEGTWECASPTKFQHHLKLEGFPTQMGIWRHVGVIPQCRRILVFYRAVSLSTDSSAFQHLPRKSRFVRADVSWHFHWAFIVLSCCDL